MSKGFSAKYTSWGRGPSPCAPLAERRAWWERFLAQAQSMLTADVVAGDVRGARFSRRDVAEAIGKLAEIAEEEAELPIGLLEVSCIRCGGVGEGAGCERCNPIETREAVTA